MMQAYVQRVWVAVGIAALVVLSAWLVSQLLYGVLIISAGVVVGVFLTQLTKVLAGMTGLSYRAAYSSMVLALFALAVGLFALLGTQIASQAGEFVRQLRESTGQLQERLQSQAWWSEVQRIRSSAVDLLSSKQAVSTATSAFASTVSALAAAVLVLFLGLYFAVQPQRYRNGLLSLVPPAKRRRMGEVADQAAQTLWYWMLGRLIGMLVIGVGSALGLWLLGVPLPVTLGVLAGVLTFVPNLGPLIALVPAVLFSLQSGAHTALYVVAFYFALQTVESYLLTPIIDQYQVSVPPGITLSAQLLLGLAGGALGLLLATPLVVVAKTVVRELYIKDVLRSDVVKTE